MKREFVTAPPGFFKPLSIDWDIDWRGQTAGEANDGTSQFVVNAFPRWVGSPSIFLRNETILQWRSIRAQAQGRLGLYVVPMCDRLTASHPAPQENGIPYSTGERFSTGRGFAYAPFVTNTVAASAGDTVLTISADVAPVAGQIMSFENSPFVVTYVDGSAGVYEIGVQMPLRKDIAAGELIDLKPKGIFEIVDGSGNPAYGASRLIAPTLRLQEFLCP